MNWEEKVNMECKGVSSTADRKLAKTDCLSIFQPLIVKGVYSIGHGRQRKRHYFSIHLLLGVRVFINRRRTSVFWTTKHYQCMSSLYMKGSMYVFRDAHKLITNEAPYVYTWIYIFIFTWSYDANNEQTFQFSTIWLYFTIESIADNALVASNVITRKRSNVERCTIDSSAVGKIFCSGFSIFYPLVAEICSTGMQLKVYWFSKYLVLSVGMDNDPKRIPSWEIIVTNLCMP